MGKADSVLPLAGLGCITAICLGALALALPRAMPADLVFLWALVFSRGRMSAIIPVAFSAVVWVYAKGTRGSRALPVNAHPAGEEPYWKVIGSICLVDALIVGITLVYGALAMVARGEWH